MLKDKELRFGNKPELKVRVSSRDFGSCVSGPREIGPVMHRNSKRNMCRYLVQRRQPPPLPTTVGGWVGVGLINALAYAWAWAAPPLSLYTGWVGGWVWVRRRYALRSDCPSRRVPQLRESK